MGSDNDNKPFIPYIFVLASKAPFITAYISFLVIFGCVYVALFGIPQSKHSLETLEHQEVSSSHTNSDSGYRDFKFHDTGPDFKYSKLENGYYYKRPFHPPQKKKEKKVLPDNIWNLNGWDTCVKVTDYLGITENKYDSDDEYDDDMYHYPWMHLDEYYRRRRTFEMDMDMFEMDDMYNDVVLNASFMYTHPQLYKCARHKTLYKDDDMFQCGFVLMDNEGNTIDISPLHHEFKYTNTKYDYKVWCDKYIHMSLHVKRQETLTSVDNTCQIYINDENIINLDLDRPYGYGFQFKCWNVGSIDLKKLVIQVKDHEKTKTWNADTNKLTQFNGQNFKKHKQTKCFIFRPNI